MVQVQVGNKCKRASSSPSFLGSRVHGQATGQQHPQGSLDQKLYFVKSVIVANSKEGRKGGILDQIKAAWVFIFLIVCSSLGV